MEWLDIVDENGNPTGEQVARSEAHARGIRHRTAHVWLLRLREGRVQLLLQKRSANKDSNPGCYDISSAGHIPAGVDYLPSALRELQEELGVCARADALIDCGLRRFYYQAVFHGKLFLDRQVSRVFALWLDREEADFTLQPEEVEAVRWMDYEACIAMVTQNTAPHCIRPEELQMLQKAFPASGKTP